MPAYRCEYFQQDWDDRDRKLRLLAGETEDPTVWASHQLVATEVVDADTPEGACERLFYKHNMDKRPFGLAFCSMSEGDVVVVNETAYLCAQFGFRKATSWREAPPARYRGLMSLIGGLERANNVPRENVESLKNALDALYGADGQLKESGPDVGWALQELEKTLTNLQAKSDELRYGTADLPGRREVAAEQLLESTQLVRQAQWEHVDYPVNGKIQIATVVLAPTLGDNENSVGRHLSVFFEPGHSEPVSYTFSPAPSYVPTL